MNPKKPFRFKQFEVHHDQAAMKVGTDGVLLGAWANLKPATNILDIGSGTGLIALMLAQRTNSKITAVEIAAAAAEEAQFNFNQSPWPQQLNIHNQSIQEFTEKCCEQFDLIVSNPPYFEKKGKLDSRSIARSQQELNLETLIHNVSKLLSSQGIFSIVLPIEMELGFLEICTSYQFFPSRICHVKGNSNSPVKRTLIELSQVKCKTKITEIAIELEQRHQYSKEYKNLLKEYLIIF